jgi:8-oxo-dGTP diphosphatase
MKDEGVERPIVDVAAAVLQKSNGEFLLAQRPEGKVYAGYWEFPGGKLHRGESVAAALERELHEELGLEVEQSYPWLIQTFTYPHARVKLHFRRVTRWRGEPQSRENQRFAWQTPDRLSVAPMLPANTFVLKALSLAPTYGITNASEYGVEAMLQRLDVALQGGLRMVQVREKAMSESELRRFAAHVIERSHACGAQVLVNSDYELARSLKADGVHLTAAQLMRLATKPDMELCGASCHDARELEQAARLGVDFAVLGPVAATGTHPAARLLGWERFENLIGNYSLPVYAIGGMRPDDLTTAWKHGAHGLAMMRGCW